MKIGKQKVSLVIECKDGESLAQEFIRFGTALAGLDEAILE